MSLTFQRTLLAITAVAHATTWYLIRSGDDHRSFMFYSFFYMIFFALPVGLIVILLSHSKTYSPAHKVLSPKKQSLRVSGAILIIGVIDMIGYQITLAERQ